MSKSDQKLPPEPENKAPEQPQAPAPVPSPLTIKPPSAETMWSEMVIAFNYLTRFSFKLDEEAKPRMIRRSMGWFPLVGALVGILGASIDWTCSMFGLPSLITATFAIIGMLWVTRALHEEEFASLVNQYSQTIDKKERVGWLNEERSVRYGTLGVILMIIMKIGAIASLGTSDLVFQGLIASCSLSRAMMVVAAAWLRPIEGDPVADYFQQPPALRVVLALALAGGLNFIVLDSYASVTLSVGLALGLLVALVGAHHLKGYSGKLLGTLQQVVEIAVLGAVLSLQ